MSDEEYEYDYGSDADSIVYSEDGSEQGGEANEDGDMKIQVENFYYEAEDLKDDDAGAAVELFQKVVLLDTELEGKGESSLWRFKALVHIVTLLFGMKNYPDMISNYKEMLKDMPSVTRNVCTESINSVLETISSSDDDKVLEEMFEITLKALTDANNEKLWFNTNLKLTKLYMSGLEKTESMDTGSSLSTEKKQDEVERLMNILKQSCSLPDGNDDPSKASQLLEIYCLEIQFCRITHNVLRMRTIYPKTLHLNVAVADPRIMGVIREEGGKMHMSEGHWDEAYTELNEAFRNFQQAGNNSRAKTCLKYVALSSMLAKDAVNPFDGREAKAFERDSDIVAMKSLHQYLQQNDLQRFEGILNDKRNGISTEEVLMTYVMGYVGVIILFFRAMAITLLCCCHIPHLVVH